MNEYLYAKYNYDTKKVSIYLCYHRDCYQEQQQQQTVANKMYKLIRKN